MLFFSLIFQCCILYFVPFCGDNLVFSQIEIIALTKVILRKQKHLVLMYDNQTII